MPTAPSHRAAPRRPIVPLLAALGLLALAGCSSALQVTQPVTGRQQILVTLKRGPKASEKSPEERQRIQAAHLENIRRLAHDGTLVLAGPYGQDNHDPTSRGIFVFDVPTLEEAQRLTATDPAVMEGVLAMELERFVTGADLRAVVKADLAREADERARGIEPKMGEHIRPYVLLRAKSARDVWGELLEAAPDAILVSGTVNDGQAFVILDAKETAKVREWLGGKLPEGTTVDEWYATDLLAGIRGGTRESGR